VELFANGDGDIIFCYGDDDDMGSPFNYFEAEAEAEDNRCHDVAYPMPNSLFDGDGITNVQCVGCFEKGPFYKIQNHEQQK